VADLSIYLLGAPRIKRLNQTINIQRRKGLAMLAYLAVTRQPYSRDYLAALFWPEYDQSGARANFRRDLSRLKSELGEHILDIRQDQVGLNPNLDLSIDVAEFQATTGQPRLHGHSLNETGTDMCTECISALQKAVDLYRGNFMEGFSLPDSPAYDEWQFFQSDSLRQKLTEALQHLVNWHSARQDYPQAIAFCRNWLAQEPFHEPAHRGLMQLYAIDGQYAAALRQYQECARLLRDELGVDPEAETSELFETIRRRKLQTAASEQISLSSASLAGNIEKGKSSRHLDRISHNLPTQPTPFVGRDEELGEIRRLIVENSDCRLLTLLGPGGSGKTRLALQTGLKVKERREDIFSSGVWLIQLAHLTEGDSIAPAMVSALKLPTYQDQAQSHRQLLDYLRRENLLLILDNFEHVLHPDNVSLVTAILESAPQVKILVTSRTRLNARGEYLYSLSGLSRPASDSSLKSVFNKSGKTYAAIELFLLSARRVIPEFQLDESNYSAVIRLCNLVEGMPLAIELAAAWIEMLTVDEINAEIHRSLDFLESDWHDLPDRQRSLRAVFNASWNLLSNNERLIIKALSVFRAGFTRQAADSVATASPKALLDLMNKSWLQRWSDDRYGIHELLRQYVFELLKGDSIEFNLVQDRYCAHYEHLGRTLWKAMRGPGQVQAHETVTFEFENMRNTWNYFLSRGQISGVVSEILNVLFLYSEVHSKSLELLQLVSAALHSLDISSEDPKDRYSLGVLYTVRGAFYKNGFPIRFETFGMIMPADEEAIRLSWSLIDSYSGSGSPRFWEIISTYVYGRTMNRSAAIERFDRLLPRLKQENRLWEWAFGLLHLSMLLLTDLEKTPEPKLVDHYLSEALQVFQVLGDEIQSGHIMRQRGNLRFLQREFQEAIHYWQAAQEKLQQSKEWVIAADIYWQMGDAYLQMGAFEKAFQSYHRIYESYLNMGYIRWAASVLSKESYEALRYSDIDHAMRTRQQSLNLAREGGDEFAEAWGIWEMGEILRVSGEFSKARGWYDNAYALFKKLPDVAGYTFYYRSLGDIALAQGDYSTAYDRFSASLAAAQSKRHEWAMVYAFTGLGKAETGLGRYEDASSHFLEALNLAKKTGDKGIALVALAGLSGFFAANGSLEQAVFLASLVVAHFASWRETSAQASGILSDLSGHLPAETFSALQTQGRTSELWSVVDHINISGVTKLDVLFRNRSQPPATISHKTSQ
jgi:predicted ATPase/DNA-binding SARP family transcriptional activator